MRAVIFFLILWQSFISIGQTEIQDIYLIPGQGSDYRIFNELQLDDSYNIIHLKYCIPDEGMTMAGFAKELHIQIDTTRPYALIGVSLGGMLAVEMNELHRPEKTIIVSSVKCRSELPGRYRLQEYFPIYEWIPSSISKQGALVLQPIVEPDRNTYRETFIAMLDAKDPVFLDRTIAMILEWDRSNCPDHIIHIHGDEDHTLPIQNIDYDHLIEDGSHMMMLTRGRELSLIIQSILKG